MKATDVERAETAYQRCVRNNKRLHGLSLGHPRLKVHQLRKRCVYRRFAMNKTFTTSAQFVSTMTLNYYVYIWKYVMIQNCNPVKYRIHDQQNSLNRIIQRDNKVNNLLLAHQASPLDVLDKEIQWKLLKGFF